MPILLCGLPTEEEIGRGRDLYANLDRIFGQGGIYAMSRTGDGGRTMYYHVANPGSHAEALRQYFDSLPPISVKVTKHSDPEWNSIREVLNGVNQHSAQHVNRHGPATAGGGFAARVGGPVIFTLAMWRSAAIAGAIELAIYVALVFWAMVRAGQGSGVWIPFTPVIQLILAVRHWALLSFLSLLPLKGAKTWKIFTIAAVIGTIFLTVVAELLGFRTLKEPLLWVAWGSQIVATALAVPCLRRSAAVET